MNVVSYEYTESSETENPYRQFRSPHKDLNLERQRDPRWKAIQKPDELKKQSHGKSDILRAVNIEMYNEYLSMT